jgi:serine/threonine protein kinase
MATVYEALDEALGRTVAVKLFRMDTADDAGPQRQSGEVMVLASLNHFALVTLFDAGSAHIHGSTRSFIVMEYIDGRDLRSRISDGPVAPAEVARMGADLAEALHYVQAKGIIHRDIKPANVLLARSDFPGRVSHAKLADFGIARLFDATHLTRTAASADERRSAGSRAVMPVSTSTQPAPRLAGISGWRCSRAMADSTAVPG